MVGTASAAALCILFLGLNPRIARGESPLRSPISAFTAPTSHRFHTVSRRGIQNFCFERKCRCSEAVADCSHNYGSLSFVPRLGKTIQSLVFSFNNLAYISRADFFHNVTKIVSLDLQNNGLRTIHPAAFSPLKKLRSVVLNHNRLYHVDLSLFVTLHNLNSLEVVASRVTNLTVACLPGLRNLDLQSNALYDLPYSCLASRSCHNTSSLLPRLKVLNFAQNKLSDVETDTCLPLLENLILSRNPISFLATDMFDERIFPNLVNLTLEEIQPITKIERFAFRNPTLQILSLMSCNIPFSDSLVHPDSFQGMPNLMHLQLSHNLGSGISDNKFQRLFGNISNLRKFNLGVCGLLDLNFNTLKTLPALKVLLLYRNKLQVIPDGAFDPLYNLTVLVLSDNELSTVRENTLSSETRQRLHHLDLSRNPFECDCELLWFKDWYRSNPALFNISYGDYKCINLPNTTLGSFHLIEQVCLLSHETYRAIIACVFVFVAVLLCVSALYHHRWHIRLMLAFRGHSDIMRRRLQQEDFDYDVFVSFTGEDLDWVQQHLMAKLETELGLRLCIHERDFVPGKNILNNIVDSVKGSKKFLMVFSRHFTHSPWCQFELDLCLGHTLDYGDALIVTCLGDVASRDLTSTMAAVLETTTYIQWRDNRDAVTSFWNRVTLSLRDIMPDNENHV